MTKTDFAHHLAEHPRLMGVLFAVCVLLGQTGVAFASNYGSPGP